MHTLNGTKFRNNMLLLAKQVSASLSSSSLLWAHVDSMWQRFMQPCADSHKCGASACVRVYVCPSVSRPLPPPRHGHTDWVTQHLMRFSRFHVAKIHRVKMRAPHLDACPKSLWRHIQSRSPLFYCRALRARRQTKWPHALCELRNIYIIS